MSHAEDILKKLIETISENENYGNYTFEIKPISSGGANYTSKLFLATISSAGKEDLNIFAKVAAIGEKMRAQAPMRFYDAERFFYTKLLDIYKKLEVEHEVPQENRLLTPKFYGCNDKLYEETIVLENLVARGFKDHNRFLSVDWDYAARAVEELAKFHALSIAYMKQDPEGFEAAKENVKFNWEEPNEEKKAFWANVLTTTLESAKEEYRDKMKKFFDQNMLDSFKSFYDPLRCTVITHGDYRPSNLMHKVHDDGRYELIPVDYQTIQSGSPVNDLLYFIFTGSDEEFRRKHYQQLVDHYYMHLSQAITRLGMDADATYSKENFYLDLKDKLPFGLFLAVFLLPIVTVEAENAPQVSEDMDISSFRVDKKSASYPERLNGIIRDYIKWEIL